MNGVVVVAQNRFGRGRPTIGDEPMVPKNIHVPPEQWDKATALAKEKSKKEKRRIVAADIYRNAVEAFFRAEQTEAQQKTEWEMPMHGVIYGGDASPIQSAPRAAHITVPWRVDPSCYALLVVGSSMESEDGISIPAGQYAIFCPQDTPIPGALVHVEWEENGERVCTFKKYIPQPNGAAIFRPLNKSKQFRARTRKAGEYEIKGVFVRSYDGKDSK